MSSMLLTEEWKKAFLMLNRRDVESPDTMRLPVGSCVHVFPSNGFTFNDRTWKPQTGYVIPSQIARLETIVSELKGFTLYQGKALKNTYWLETYYPLGDSVIRTYISGMLEVGLLISNTNEAIKTLETRHDIPLCPVCLDYDMYTTDEKLKHVYDTASKYFTYYWVYGEPI